MFALSGYAESFWLMCMNIKPVENRTWPLPISINCDLPARIYLHASQTKAPKDQIEFILNTLQLVEKSMFENVNFNTLRGKIIGEVTITKCIKKAWENPRSSLSTQGGLFSMGDMLEEMKLLKKDCPEYFSPWFFGPYGFVVKDGVLYPDHKQLKCKGRLGFFIPDLGPVKG